MKLNHLLTTSMRKKVVILVVRVGTNLSENQKFAPFVDTFLKEIGGKVLMHIIKQIMKKKPELIMVNGGKECVKNIKGTNKKSLYFFQKVINS